MEGTSARVMEILKDAIWQMQILHLMIVASGFCESKLPKKIILIEELLTWIKNPPDRKIVNFPGCR